jgi:hypothetical protein
MDIWWLVFAELLDIMSFVIAWLQELRSILPLPILLLTYTLNRSTYSIHPTRGLSHSGRLVLVHFGTNQLGTNHIF